MEARGTRKRWTYAEFARLPESGSTRYEVIDHHLVVTPGPSRQHQRTVGELFYRLMGFVKANELGELFTGPFDILLAEGDYLEPDILFVRSDHAGLVSDRGVEGPPDLVVEVASPSTAHRDRGIKLDRYRLYGVPEYWVVDPDERTVEVWQVGQASSEPIVYGPEDTLRWEPLPGGLSLEIVLGEVFGD
jgi:Uma2 family endonuclease